MLAPAENTKTVPKPIRIRMGISIYIESVDLLVAGNEGISVISAFYAVLL